MRRIFKRLFAKKEEPKEVYTVVPRWRSWEETARDYDAIQANNRKVVAMETTEVRDEKV